MEKKFMLGCNYWASNAGADMWRHWDADCVKKELALLKEYGMDTLRVFPNWRDFQPVERLFGGEGSPKECWLVGDIRPENPYYLDETMLKRFGEFCRIAEETGLSLIVGLVTGWMSGRLYLPPALYGKNLYSDPFALKLQHLLITGFVSRFKNQPCIVAWDLGNECNCMGHANTPEEAYSWTAFITGAIRSADPSRRILSGMHSLELEESWNIPDQGFLTDELTTHPYPYWVEHCMVDPLTSCRTLLHATAQTRYYATVSRKPCLVEEIGSMGPMVADEERTAGFMRVNLFSNWANGATGLLWWCANEQSMLSAPPYDWNMCERELGMTDANGKPKPMLKEMKAFSRFLAETAPELPPYRPDGVCILSKEQDAWGMAYTSYILAKQAGLSLDFAFCEQELPESDLYLLPSVSGMVMSKFAYDGLKEKVRKGATLYLSMHDGFLTEFEELTGLRVAYSRNATEQGSFALDGTSLTYCKEHSVRLEPTRAEILAEDDNKNPLIARAAYGKGTVYFVNFPLEKMLLKLPDFPEKGYYKIYARLFSSQTDQKNVRCDNPFIGVTEHGTTPERTVVLVNYSDKPQPTELCLKAPFKIGKVLYGDVETLAPCDAAVFTIKE